jgi:pimeloyl-ACP methyl ester carboxylesterase
MKLLNLYPSNPHLPLLVYCPGMDGTGRLLDRQAKYLQHYFNIRCLSYPYETGETWESLSIKAINLIQKELYSLSQPISTSLPRFNASPVNQPSVYLLGESFGGCLALKTLNKAPWLFKKVILVNSASAFRLRNWLNLGGMITRWLPDFLHQGSCLGLLPFLASLGRLNVNDRRALLQAMRSLPAAAVSDRISLLNEFNLNPHSLKYLPQSFLILASKSDRLLPSLEEGQQLKTLLPNAELVVLPESGHACLLEKELNLTKILKEKHFLPAKSLESVF